MTADHPDMYCIDCDYPIAGLHSRACPECGRAFDPDDLRSFRRRLSEPTALRSNISVMHAHLLRNLLEARGIPAVVLETGGVFESLATGASLFVSKSELEPAREALDAIDNDAARNSSEPEKEWTCTTCGELNDAGFTACWNCQCELDPGPTDS